jgi:hypothetical protein
MKALIHVLCVAGVVLFRPVRAVGAEEDPRFVAGNAGTENAYMDGFAVSAQPRGTSRAAA